MKYRNFLGYTSFFALYNTIHEPDFAIGPFKLTCFVLLYQSDFQQLLWNFKSRSLGQDLVISLVELLLVVCLLLIHAVIYASCLTALCRFGLTEPSVRRKPKSFTTVLLLLP